MRQLRFGNNSDAHVIPNLIDVLKKVLLNDWSWSVLEFDGIGITPDDLNMSDFEDGLGLADKGWVVGWSELVRFAQGISWCFIVAVDSIEKIKNRRSR